MSTIGCERGQILVALVLASSLLLGPLPAAAQSEDRAAARALFDEGRRLIKSEDYSAACPKFEAAAKLYPGPGVLLNLGDCYEHTNRTASAWTEFAESEAAAARAGLTQEEAEATRRRASIEARLCRLRVHVAADVAGLSVHRDDKLIDRAMWQMPIPVDAGKHVLTASAPGKVGWSLTVRTDEPCGLVVVEIPELADVARVPSLASSAIPARSSLSRATFEVAGISGIGLGVMGLAGGAILALVAKGTDNQAAAEADDARRRNSVVSADAARTDSSTAVSEGNIATVLAIGGAVAAVAGTVLWLMAPRARVRIATDGHGGAVGGFFE